MVRGLQSNRSCAREISGRLFRIVLRSATVNDARMRAGQIDYHGGQVQHGEFNRIADVYRTDHLRLGRHQPD
jgi:hypothetical protein